MDLQTIEKRLAVILSDAKEWLPAEQQTDMQSLVAAGEPGVALENFCAQLEEYDVVVPDQVVQELCEMAALMGMNVSPRIAGGRTSD